MACRLALSHCLNHRWNIVNWALRDNLQWNLNWNSCIFFQGNAFENVVRKMSAILSRPQWVKVNILSVHRVHDALTVHVATTAAVETKTPIWSWFHVSMSHNILTQANSYDGSVAQIQNTCNMIFLHPSLLWKYQIELVAMELSCIVFILPCMVFILTASIFCRGVSSVVTGYPCGVWGRGLSNYTLTPHIGPFFGNLF